MPELVIRVRKDEQPAHLASAFCGLKEVLFRRQGLRYAHDQKVPLLCGDLNAGYHNDIEIIGLHVFNGVCRALYGVVVDDCHGIKPYFYCSVYYVLYSALAVA